MLCKIIGVLWYGSNRLCKGQMFSCLLGLVGQISWLFAGLVLVRYILRR